MGAVFGSMACAILIALWWALLSRAKGWDRLWPLLLAVATVYGVSFLADPSITKGAMGMLLYILSIPFAAVALVAGALVSRNLDDRTRRMAIAGAILVACASFALIRTGGFTGAFENDLSWRWTPSPEERLVATMPPPPPPVAVAAAVSAPTVPEAAAVVKETPKPVVATVEEEPVVPAAWPAFRGPAGDGSAPGVRIDPDWAAHPPKQVWKRPVGPGWSSFAVAGDLLYTQEQRGEDELVSCYRLSSGEPVWAHRSKARFWESNAGAGPRGTPTLAGGRVYAFGGTGILNALDAKTGRVIWSRNAAQDAAMKTPEWGFASSPLVLEQAVIVGVSGRLAAYEKATGKPLWLGPEGGGTSYSSPRLSRGQVLFLQKPGVVSVQPSDGKLLWDYKWAGYPIVQPAVLPDGDMVLSVDDSSGIRRIGSKGEDRWASTGLKPYYNDFVIHKGHAYGFDRSILACVDLQDGKRKWKGGRYGFGQLVLLPEQDLLVILSEEGELALARATPEGFAEVAAKVPALEGKTWNHPAIAGDLLLVRNAQEMAAFRLERRK
ncbi:alcohol dehydrogenase [Bryobacterales bacterium F-183]|nr:alcohol dehydrogenase [Bryobacterales bacterium F-183]